MLTSRSNDLVVQGAEALGFLDCYTCGKLDGSVAVGVLEGIAKGCRRAGCAILGGETAEMPGLFLRRNGSEEDGGVYDIVGAAFGAISQGQRILPDTDSMRTGDIVLGLTSSGCHSNGFSLVRKIVERAGLSYSDSAPWTDDTTTVGESLLTPTRIYVRSILAALHHIMGAAHITGGGLIENGRMSQSCL